MLATIQRVSKSFSVFIDEKNFQAISKGVAFFYVQKVEILKCKRKKCSTPYNFKNLEEDSNTMSARLKELEEDVLIVSQFTLAAITNKGPKASFHKAAKASEAKLLYEQFVNLFKDTRCKIATGVFGKNMNVAMVNNGPVTFNFKT